jgi:hypothetical protein
MKQVSLYTVDYEKVGPDCQAKRQLLFSFFQSLSVFSLGSEKLIIIFALAKRIRV